MYSLRRLLPYFFKIIYFGLVRVIIIMYQYEHNDPRMVSVSHEENKLMVQVLKAADLAADLDLGFLLTLQSLRPS